jgi:hypothetical protein
LNYRGLSAHRLLAYIPVKMETKNNTRNLPQVMIGAKKEIAQELS